MKADCKLTGLSGNEIYCMRLIQLPVEFQAAPVTSDLTGEELGAMAQLGYMPIKFLISTSVYSLGAIGGIKAALRSFVKGEIGDLTTLICDARAGG